MTFYYGCNQPYFNENDYDLNQNERQMPNIPDIEELPTGPPENYNLVPVSPRLPVARPGELVPTTLESTMYTPGYLKTQIGKTVRVEFLIGTNGPLVDRIGTLLEVGASYIIIRPIGTDDTLLCDIYSIKFVTFYRTPIVR